MKTKDFINKKIKGWHEKRFGSSGEILIFYDEIEEWLEEYASQHSVNLPVSSNEALRVALPSQKERHDEMEKIAELFTDKTADKTANKKRNFIRGWRECEGYLLPFLRR